MLVLTRKTGTEIMVGDDIVITILGIQGDRVRVGVSAPRNIPVNRGEIYAEIQQAKQTEAVDAVPGPFKAAGHGTRVTS